MKLHSMKKLRAIILYNLEIISIAFKNREWSKLITWLCIFLISYTIWYRVFTWILF